MRGYKLGILLAVAAAAVAMQNYIFFSNLAVAPNSVPDDEEDEGLLDWDDEELVALDVLEESLVASWIAERLGQPRNPFLTAEEDRRLAGPRDAIAIGLPRVTGTLWSENRRVAWIDGRPRSEGDWVGDHRILRIEPTRVALSRPEGEDPMVLSVARAPTVIEEEIDE